MNTSSRRLFLLLSAALFLTTLAFLGLHYQTDKQKLVASFQRDGERKQAAYELVYQSTLVNLMHIATLVSMDNLVHTSLVSANGTLRAEGGGRGGPRSAALREAIMKDVAPGWAVMARDFGARQMQFHFGPQITSFLRVHKPEHFGDDLAALRPIVADTFREAKARTGLEIGVHAVGLRAVLPVHANAVGAPIGTLEVGASFQELFKTLDHQFDTGIAALLRHEKVTPIMAKTDVDNRYDALSQLCGCMVEAASRPIEAVLTAYLRAQPQPAAHTTSKAETVWLQMGQEHMAVTRFGLADYQDLRDRTGRSAGAILLWHNVDAEVAAFQTHVRNNVAAALAVFLLLEVFLFFAVRAAMAHLETLVDKRTAELGQANANLAREVDQHALTQDKLEDTELFWGAVAENIHSPLMVIGTDFRIQLTNTAARGQWGATLPPDITCHKLSHHRETPCCGEDAPCPLQHVLSTGEPTTVTHQHYDRDGSTHIVNLHAWPNRDASGRITGIIEIGEDVTAKHHAQEALEESERTMAIAQQLAGLGSWHLDAASNQITCSAEMLRIAGLPPDETTFDLERLRDLVHPDDRATVRLAWQAALNARQAFDMTLRMQVADAIKWVHEQAEFSFDAHDRLVSAIGTVLDITAQRQAETALLEAKSQAEAASVAKSAFIANMSHEIRTPLNAITGMAHLIRQSGLNPEQTTRFVKLETASQHLLEIINAILQLSAIEAGKISPADTTINIERVVGNVMAMQQDRAEAKSLRFTREIAPLPAPLRGDAVRLQQALLNYAGNAVKFTDSGHVTLRVKLQEESATDVLLRFEVEDTGIGITPQELKRLFNAFEQADNSSTRKYGGTGLGLAITKRFAHLMGGDAGAESRIGHGSTFWFTARLKKGVAGNASPPAPEDNADVLAALRRDCAGRRCLLAEDEPINREITSILLKDAGLAVDIAEDGGEALERAKAQTYDLILMDMQMPRMNGLEATQHIRQLPNGGQTPIIALTANAFEEDRERCLAAGMSDFVTKPVEPERLYATLLHWLLAGNARTVQDTAPPAPESATAMDWEALREQIATLLSLLAGADMESIRFIQELNPRLVRVSGEIALTLRQQIENFEFDAARDTLNTIQIQEPRLGTVDDSKVRQAAGRGQNMRAVPR
jgi:signal transduction histidine kinase/DNA-binding NarL/FixJ family response regulator